MLKKNCCLLLAAFMLQAALVRPAAAKADAKKEAERAEKVRAEMSKLGTGADARVKVELRDKTKLEGFVSEAGAEHFAVTDKSGTTTRVSYEQVRKVRGHNLSTGAKVGIGVAVGAAVTLLVLYLVYAANER